MKRDLSLYVGLVYRAANTQGQQAVPVKIQAVDMSEVCQRKLNVLLLNTLHTLLFWSRNILYEMVHHPCKLAVFFQHALSHIITCFFAPNPYY